MLHYFWKVLKGQQYSTASAKVLKEQQYSKASVSHERWGDQQRLFLSWRDTCDAGTLKVWKGLNYAAVSMILNTGPSALNRWRSPFRFLSCQFATALIASLASVLRQTSTLKPMRETHAFIITSGLSHNIFLSNTLISSYFYLGLPTIANLVFKQFPIKNVFSWTIMISGYSQNKLFVEAIDIFSDMTASGVSPNPVTFASMLPACAHLGLLNLGKSVHSCLIRSHCQHNVYAETALLDFYSKCGFLSTALNLFGRMSVKNVVSWNAIILACSDNGSEQEALLFFIQMQRDKFKADFVTVVALLRACSSTGCLRVGCMVRSWIIKSGFGDDQLVQTAVMEMYVKCNCTEEAYSLFREKEAKDVVAWTLMIWSFLEIRHGHKAMELSNQMMAAFDVKLDDIALVGALSSCSRLGALGQGRRVHGLVVKFGFETDTYVGTALIDTYANCGSLENARKLFSGMRKKDVVCWNAMISGNGMSGLGEDAVDLFLQMKQAGLKPDETTFVSVLCACSHAGQVEQGIHIFDSMAKEWGLVPTLQHYACLVDLLGRAGRLNDAYFLVKNMDLKPNANIYGALLGACRNHGDIDMALKISDKLLELNPDDAGYYVLLSNIYATGGDWEGVKRMRVALRSKGLKKTPGFSSVEIDRKIYSFVAGEKDHPQYPEINEMLKHLVMKIEEAGYVPDIKLVLQDVPEEVKNDILYHHSEKLAIAFGLLFTESETLIRITKNLRMCSDCHTATKFISMVVSREIVVKDANRFHYFKEGNCSCKNYW